MYHGDIDGAFELIYPELMRRLVLAFLAILIGATALLVSRGRAVQAQSYGPDVATSGQAFDCGHNSSYVAGNAYDDNLATQWQSSQFGTNVTLNACLGQDFGAATHQIRQLWIKQSATSTAEITTVLAQVSSDCSTYSTVDTLTIPQDGDWHPHALSASYAARCWRILAGSAPASGSWAAVEIQMMELASWPTNTPGPSSTPTITLTPSTTPSPTPNYYIETTSTQGSPMRFERSAREGDVYIVGGLGIVAVILIIGFAVLYWRLP